MTMLRSRRRGGVGSARTVICEASESGDLGTGTGVITPGVPDTMLMTGGESRTDKLWRVYSKWLVLWTPLRGPRGPFRSKILSFGSILLLRKCAIGRTTPFVRYSISCSISNVLYFVVYLLLLSTAPLKPATVILICSS